MCSNGLAMTQISPPAMFSTINSQICRMFPKTGQRNNCVSQEFVEEGENQMSQKTPWYIITGDYIQNHIIWFPTTKYKLSVFLAFDGLVSWEKAIWWLAQSIWAQSSHLGRYRDPPSPPSKGVGSVEGEECDQIWAKFGPYIELWLNIPTLCGSHLGKMDPQASPNYAWQAAGGLKMWELYQAPACNRFLLSLCILCAHLLEL